MAMISRDTLIRTLDAVRSARKVVESDLVGRPENDPATPFLVAMRRALQNAEQAGAKGTAVLGLIELEADLVRVQAQIDVMRAVVNG